jgi:2-polyprenyl-3-methyl-5-hydroxy-6-metoxy-1,4-benzoquinol methylase
MFKRKVDKHQEEYFSGLESARAFAASAEKSTRRYLAFLDRIKRLNIQGKYLDVGAGAGNLATIIAQRNPDVEITALEISADMVTVGEELVREKGVHDQINFVQGDAADQDTINELGKYDLIYSTYTFHHWDNPRKVIDNLMPILREGGVLYLYDLRRVWWLYWIPNRSGFFTSIRASFVRSEIEEMLHGLEPGSYEIKNEFPFMQSIIIRKT